MTEPSEWADLWRDLCEKDDRTSPEEYPDMALLTFEEFCSLLAAARRRGIEEAALRCVRLGFERYDQGAEPQVASAYHNAAAAIRALADKEPT